MRSRYALVEALLKVNTAAAVQDALDNLLDMLRLCPGDNMGMRSEVPALFIRLGQDQECYDFIKWWNTTGSSGDYETGPGEPFLDIKGADMLEALDKSVVAIYPDLNRTIGLTLLKIRLLFDLRQLHNAAALRAKAPQEIVDTIRSHLASATIASSPTLLRDVQNGKDLQPYMDLLESQLWTLYGVVVKANVHFWPAGI